MTSDASQPLPSPPAGAGIRLRPAAAGDIGAIQAIYAHHVLTGCASFETTPPTVEEIGRRHADVIGKGLPYLVAEIDGGVAGYAYAAPFRARVAYRYTLEDSVYVAPGMAGRGIGRILLAEVVARCEALGYRQMIAVIGDSANAASIALHRRLGFELTGTLPAVGRKFGRWIDSVYMQRSLGAGDATPPDIDD